MNPELSTALAEIDLAAGGILLAPRDSGERTGELAAERADPAESNDSIRIAVVLRHRHGDCGLPKGHPQRGEGLREAALREVLEETGFTASVQRMLAPVSYLAGGVPKLVVFFEMRALSIAGPPDASEVSEVLWLKPADALARLSYPGERQLVAELFGC